MRTSFCCLHSTPWAPTELTLSVVWLPGPYPPCPQGDLPIGGVASVCRPTIWAGPSPSRKSLNWLSAPSRVVGKTNLEKKADGHKRVSGWQGAVTVPLGHRHAPVPQFSPLSVLLWLGTNKTIYLCTLKKTTLMSLEKRD